jgi:acetyl esterase/lipase
LDTEVEAAFASMSAGSHLAGTVGITDVDSIYRMRETSAALRPTLEKLRADGSVEAWDETIAGRDGEPDVAVFVMRRAEGRPIAAPAILFVHGSGMVVGGSARMGLAEAVGWVRDLGAVVVGVDYRVAPEDPYPAAVDDCYATLIWMVADAARLTAAAAAAGSPPGRPCAAGIKMVRRSPIKSWPARCSTTVT